MRFDTDKEIKGIVQMVYLVQSKENDTPMEYFQKEITDICDTYKGKCGSLVLELESQGCKILNNTMLPIYDDVSNYQIKINCYELLEFDVDFEHSEFSFDGYPLIYKLTLNNHQLKVFKTSKGLREHFYTNDKEGEVSFLLDHDYINNSLRLTDLIGYVNTRDDLVSPLCPKYFRKVSKVWELSIPAAL